MTSLTRKEKDVLLKVGRLRTVLILEGAMNENGPWKELDFYHVPSSPEKMPSIIRKFHILLGCLISWSIILDLNP